MEYKKIIKLLNYFMIINLVLILSSCVPESPLDPAEILDVTIEMPEGGDTFKIGQAITFYGLVVTDKPTQYVDWEWKSSINGVFGSKHEVTIDNLSAGTHTITFTFTHTGTESSKEDKITIEIIEEAEISFTYEDFYPEENKVTVDASANSNIQKYKWKLMRSYPGYGLLTIQETDTLQVPVHTFDDLEPVTGEFLIELTAIDNLGETTIVEKGFERGVSSK